MTFPQAPSERNSCIALAQDRCGLLAAAHQCRGTLSTASACRGSPNRPRAAHRDAGHRAEPAWPISNNRPMWTSAGRRRSARPNSPPRGRRWTNG